MPYDPHQQYVGGQLLSQGLQNFGQSAAEAIQNVQKTQQELAADQQILNMGTQMTNPVTGKPYVDPATMNEYLTGNDNKKKGIVAGLARNFATSMQQQQMQALEEQRKSMAQYRQTEAARQQALTIPQAMTPEHEAMLQRAGYQPTFTPGKGWEYLPFTGDGGTGGAPKVSAFPDVNNPGQSVPGVSIVQFPGSKTGQIVTNPDVKKPTSLQSYLGGLKASDLDPNGAFDSPKAKGFTEVPVINPSYDPNQAGPAPTHFFGLTGGQSRPAGLKYDQIPNPDFKSFSQTPNTPPTITKTVRIPTSTWSKFQGGAAADAPDTATQAQAAPPPVGVQSGQVAHGYGNPPPLPPKSGTKIDPKTADVYIARHGGDPNAAMVEAQQNGWTF